MNEPLKLIEGMKKLKVLEKHIARNTERIQEYAAIPSNERPQLGSEAEQKEEIKRLIQANRDIVSEYIHLKKRVDMTNLITNVTIGKESFKIADLLILRRGLAKRMEATFTALNTKLSDEKIRQMQTRIAVQSGEKPVHTVRLYDENHRIEKLQEWQSLQDEIEQRLEVINAMTELVLI